MICVKYKITSFIVKLGIKLHLFLCSYTLGEFVNYITT